jgi:DNA-binding NarL/FixJ family response regulator
LFEARAHEIADRREEALVLYRRCGATGEVRRLGREVRAAGPDAGDVLSSRERTIADLVAAGMANRAAAASLGVSEKSIEKTLTSIYAKLGLNSRTQLVAYITTERSAR